MLLNKFTYRYATQQPKLCSFPMFDSIATALHLASSTSHSSPPLFRRAINEAVIALSVAAFVCRFRSTNSGTSASTHRHDLHGFLTRRLLQDFHRSVVPSTRPSLHCPSPPSFADSTLQTVVRPQAVIGTTCIVPHSTSPSRLPPFSSWPSTRPSLHCPSPPSFRRLHFTNSGASAGCHWHNMHCLLSPT